MENLSTWRYPWWCFRGFNVFLVYPKILSITHTLTQTIADQKFYKFPSMLNFKLNKMLIYKLNRCFSSIAEKLSLFKNLLLWMQQYQARKSTSTQIKVNVFGLDKKNLLWGTQPDLSAGLALKISSKLSLGIAGKYWPCR